METCDQLMWELADILERERKKKKKNNIFFKFVRKGN